MLLMLITSSPSGRYLGNSGPEARMSTKPGETPRFDSVTRRKTRQDQQECRGPAIVGGKALHAGLRSVRVAARELAVIPESEGAAARGVNDARSVDGHGELGAVARED